VTSPPTVKELMRRAGHASPAAALRYQRATEERDKVLVDALAEWATRAVPVAAIQLREVPSGKR